MKHSIYVSKRSKVLQFLDEVSNFFMDFMMLLFGWFISKNSSKKKIYSSDEINDFFMTKIGKI